MDWFKGTSSRKTPKHGKIDGFRLRFSLQPIHWATQFWENVRNGDLLSLTNPSVASSSYCPSAPQTHVTRKTMVDAKQLQLDSTITGNIISYIFCSMGKDGKMRKPTKIVFLLWFSQSKQLVWFQVFVALAPVYGSNVGSPSCKSHSCSPWQPWPVNPWVTCSRSRFGHTQDLWRTGYVVCLVCIWIHEYKYIYVKHILYIYIYTYIACIYIYVCIHSMHIYIYVVNVYDIVWYSVYSVILTPDWCGIPFIVEGSLNI